MLLTQGVVHGRVSKLNKFPWRISECYSAFWVSLSVIGRTTLSRLTWIILLGDNEVQAMALANLQVAKVFLSTRFYVVIAN